ncbi:MAG TPA: hypothetical protein VK028_04790 [Micromonosporaceae bacterium]|nr:hypothetical protein [Micromonosporaceae bacterium]
MTGDLVQRIAASVDRTYNAGTARFRWRMPAEGEWLGLSTGAVDFRAGRLAMRSRFAMPGSAAGAQGSPAGDQDGSTQIVTTHSVVSGGVLYTLQGPEESTDSQFWIAIELGSEGLAATPVGMLAWLRGATTAEATDPTAPAAVVVNVPRAIERAPKAEQAMLRQAWESARVGLSDATIAADVVLDQDGRLAHMRATVPPGTSPWFAIAHGEETMLLELHQFGAPVSIPQPDPQLRVSIAEFFSASRWRRTTPGGHRAPGSPGRSGPRLSRPPPTGAPSPSPATG